MFQPREVLRGLRTQHQKNLAEDQCVVLALRLCGRSEAEIGEALGMSASTVHRRIERLYDAVFVPLGIKPDGWLCAWWVTIHYGCCTKRVFELIENSEESFEVS